MDPTSPSRTLLPIVSGTVVSTGGGLTRGSVYHEVASGDPQYASNPMMHGAVTYDMGSVRGDFRGTVSQGVSVLNASPATSYTGSSLSSDKICLVCGDEALGRHFGVLTCEACKSFFRRSVRQAAQYFCRYNRNCAVHKQSRNKCQYCRYQKCIGVGMQPEAVQEERNPSSVKAPRTPTTPGVSLTQQLLPSTPSAQLTGGPPPSSMPASPRAITLPLLLQAERAWPNDQPVQVGSAATSFEDVLTSTKDQLHFAIEWAKMLPPFFDLALEDQVTVLKCVWNELLTLRLAFRPSPVEDALVLGTGQLLRRDQGEPGLRRWVGRFLDEIVAPCKAMNLEMAELVCMKALVLFNPDCQKLRNPQIVESLQEQCMELLNEYCRARFPEQKLRFSKILFRLSAVRSITTETRDCLIRQKSQLQGEGKIDSFVLEMLDG